MIEYRAGALMVKMPATGFSLLLTFHLSFEHYIHPWNNK